MCAVIALEQRDFAPNVGTVLFTAKDLHKKQWSKSEIALLRARRYFQTLLPPPVFINNFNEDYVNILIGYFRDAYHAIKREAPDRETDAIMTTALSDAIGGYLKVWVLPVAKLDYYGGTVSQDNIVKLFQLYDELKRYLETDGVGWREPDEKVLNSMTINVAPLKIVTNTRSMKDPCDNLAYFEKTETGLGIPIPNVNWNDRSSTMFIPLKNSSLIRMNTPNSSQNLIKYYDAAKNCIQSSNPKEQEKFDEKFQDWLANEVVPHLKDENLYLALGSVLTLVNKTRDLCNNVIDLYGNRFNVCKKPPSHPLIDFSCKKMWIICLILLIEVAWCIPALIYILCARKIKKKDRTSNVYLFIDNNKMDKKGKGVFKGKTSYLVEDTCTLPEVNSYDTTSDNKPELKLFRRSHLTDVEGEGQMPTSKIVKTVGIGSNVCCVPSSPVAYKMTSEVPKQTDVIIKKSSLKKPNLNVYPDQRNSMQLLALSSQDQGFSCSSKPTQSGTSFSTVQNAPKNLRGGSASDHRNRKKQGKFDYRRCDDRRKSEDCCRIPCEVSSSRLHEEQRRFEELRKAEEYKKLEERRRAEELKKLEERRRAEECKQLEERKKIEERKRAEEYKKQEERRRAEEYKRLEELRKAEECKRIEELKKAEERRKLEERKRIEECKKLEERRKAEELKMAEDRRKAEELKKIEERQKAEEYRKLEERRRIEEYKKQEGRRRAEENKNAAELNKIKEQTKAEECQQLNQYRKLEDHRSTDEARMVKNRRRAEECRMMEKQDNCKLVEGGMLQKLEECRSIEERMKEPNDEQRELEKFRKQMPDDSKPFSEDQNLEEVRHLEEYKIHEGTVKYDETMKYDEVKNYDEINYDAKNYNDVRNYDEANKLNITRDVNEFRNYKEIKRHEDFEKYDKPREHTDYKGNIEHKNLENYKDIDNRRQFDAHRDSKEGIDGNNKSDSLTNLFSGSEIYNEFRKSEDRIVQDSNSYNNMTSNNIDDPIAQKGSHFCYTDQAVRDGGCCNNAGDRGGYEGNCCSTIVDRVAQKSSCCNSKTDERELRGFSCSRKTDDPLARERYCARPGHKWQDDNSCDKIENRRERENSCIKKTENRKERNNSIHSFENRKARQNSFYLRTKDKKDNSKMNEGTNLVNEVRYETLESKASEYADYNTQLVESRDTVPSQLHKNPCPCKDCVENCDSQSTSTTCREVKSSSVSKHLSDKPVPRKTTRFQVTKEKTPAKDRAKSKNKVEVKTGKSPYLEITIDRPTTEICVDMGKPHYSSFKPSKIPKRAGNVQPFHNRKESDPPEKQKSLIPQLKKKTLDDIALAQCGCPRSNDRLNDTF
ncbi:hypothetical protein HF086_001947 [Spodoptera exigua]|uniref:Uncharacterized protein n=1 Tax=Spodoptera exigua TaxID=7107 RepID=A0A922SKH5_SPOEX|nr:hypothetical protein HF086_001947 [Spodoptera exigua]